MQEEAYEILTYTNQYGTVEISVREECSHIDQIIDNLVRPMLKGAGFADVTIASVLGEH